METTKSEIKLTAKNIASLDRESRKSVLNSLSTEQLDELDKQCTKHLLRDTAITVGLAAAGIGLLVFGLRQ